VGSTGQHSGCNLSLLLSGPGYCLMFQEKRPKTEQDWKQRSFFFPLNRQGAGCWSRFRLSLLTIIISIVMLKEWESHLILKVCQAPLTVPLEPHELQRTAPYTGINFWMGLLIQLGRKIYDKEAQDINKLVFLFIF